MNLVGLGAIMGLKKVIIVELNLATFLSLAELAKGNAIYTDADDSDSDKAKAVIHALIKNAARGVKSAESWQRKWLEQAFGDEWHQEENSDETNDNNE